MDQDQVSDQDVDAVLEALWNTAHDRLTPWESDFLISVGDQWRRSGRLIGEQRAKLSEIAGKYLGRGLTCDEAALW